MAPTTVLDIGIVGAGIAGLSAAIATCRAGHTVTLYERSSFKCEVGAAINMPCHVSRILRTWGFDTEAAHGHVPTQLRNLKASTAQVGRRELIEGLEQTYGEPFWLYHRADLHTELRRLAEEAGAKIQLGRGVADIDCKNGILTFADGSVESKDLVIAADGVNTPFVLGLTGIDTPTERSGRSVYRTLVPMSKVLRYEATRELFQHDYLGMTGAMNPVTNTLLVAYPCRDAELLNVAVIHPTRPDDFLSDSMYIISTRDDSYADSPQPGTRLHPCMMPSMLWKDSILHSERC